MVASLILGIGVLAATRLFTSTARGSSQIRANTVAAEMATQRVERLAVMPQDQLPACAMAGGEPAGCRATITTMREPLNDSAAFLCTQTVDEMAIVDPTVYSPSGKYRIDTVIEPHPDAARFPDASLGIVSVCWTDSSQRVQQVQARRILLP